MKWIMPIIHFAVCCFLLRDIMILFIGGSISLGSIRMTYIGMFCLWVTFLIQTIKQKRSGE